MKTFLLTGGAGFIGSYLAERIQENLSNDDKLIIIDNLSSGRKTNIQHILNDDRITFFELDINQIDSIKNDIPKKIDFVFHLAGLADIVPSIDNPRTYFQSNVQGTISLLEFLRGLSEPIQKLVYAASSSCYGIPNEFPTKENSELKPEYPYALTKLQGEELILHWGKIYKLPVISLRLFNVYGPRARTSGTYGAVFGVFMAQINAGVPLTIVGDGSQSRDFTFVTDVAEAFWTAAQSDRMNEVYNVGSDNHYKILDLVKLLNHEFCHIPKRPGEPDITFADISKIKEHIGWHPKVSFTKGVQKMIENIKLFSDAPVWTPELIEMETKSWFKSLK